MIDSDDPMTMQHARVLAAEAQLFAAALAYEMAAASFDVAARARTAASMSLTEHRNRLAEVERKNQPGTAQEN